MTIKPTFAELRAEATSILHRCARVPSGVPFGLVAHICVEFLMAGGDRTMMFTILYDNQNNKILLHIGAANTFFSLNTERTLGDLLEYFFRGRKQEVIVGSPTEILGVPLEYLKSQALGHITVRCT